MMSARPFSLLLLRVCDELISCPLLLLLLQSPKINKPPLFPMNRIYMPCWKKKRPKLNP
jgi:hypothetical protein